MFFDFYNYITNKKTSTDSLCSICFVCLILSIVSFWMLMHREPVPEELLFSEAFKHELDAYDILEKCSSALTGMTFTVNNVIFFCRNIGIYEESHRLTKVVTCVVLLFAALLFLYTFYRVLTRIFRTKQTTLPQ